MGRPRTIDRDQVLDAAAVLLLEQGTGALTMEVIARAVGVSKGGLQARFGSKEELIEALMARWREEYDSAARPLPGDSPAPVRAVRCHILLRGRMLSQSRAWAAGPLAALIGAGTRRAAWSRWYLERFGGLGGGSLEARRARLAFLAVEGAFRLRAFGCVTPGDQDWQDALADIEALLDGEFPRRPPPFPARGTPCP